MRSLTNAAAIEQSQKLAVALFAAFAGAGVAAAAAGAPNWVAAAFAFVAAVGAVVTLVLVWSHQRAQRRERLESMTLRRAIRVGDAAEAHRFYELGVETEAQEAVRQLGDDGHARYVPRDVDGGLVHALSAAASSVGVTLVVVSGPPKAGKSRTAIEAAAAAMPDAWLISPAGADALVKLANAGCPAEVGPGQPCVLWLDDIELFARPGGRGLGPDTLEVLHGWARPVVVLATHGGKGIAIAGPDAARFQETTSDLLRRHPPFRLAAELSHDERARVGDMYGEAVAARLQRAGIGEFMVAAPRLIDRLETERDCPEGRAVALAAIDCQRAGLVRPLPVEWLEEIYGRYLPGPTAPDRFARGLEWATQPMYSRVALLVRNEEDPPGYAAYDYVVAHVQRRGSSIDDLVLDRVARTYADTEQELLLVGMAAYGRGGEERALAAWARADERGSFYGAYNLALLLERRGELSAAQAAYGRADERGSADVAGYLGANPSVAIERRGALMQEDAYRLADDQGDADAAVALGLILARRGDTEAAEAAFRRADERGSFNGAFNLAVLLMRRGDLDGAEAAHRRAEEREAASRRPANGGSRPSTAQAPSPTGHDTPVPPRPQ